MRSGLDLAGAGVLVDVVGRHAAAPDVIAEIPEVVQEVAVRIDRACAIEGEFGQNIPGEVGAGIGEGGIVDDDLEIEHGLGRVGAQRGAELVAAGHLWRPFDERIDVAPGAEVIDVDLAEDNLGLVGLYDGEGNQAAFGGDAVVGDHGADGGLVADGGRQAEVEDRFDEFVAADGRVGLGFVEDQLEAACGRGIVGPKDVELIGCHVDFFDDQGGAEIEGVGGAFGLFASLLVDEAEFVHEIEVAVSAPEVVPAQVGVLAAGRAGLRDRADVGLRHRVGHDDADIAVSLGHDQLEGAILRSGRASDLHVLWDEDGQAQPGSEVDQVIGEAILVPVDQAEVVVRILGVGEEAVVFDDLGADAQDEGIDLHTFVGAVRHLGGELDELAVEGGLHDPVTANETVRLNIAQDEPGDVAGDTAEAAADDAEVDEQAGLVIDDLGLAGIDFQIGGDAVAVVLDQQPQFEGNVALDLPRDVVVQIELGLRMDRDLDLVGHHFFEPAVLVVGQHRLHVVGLPVQIRAAQAFARDQDPPAAHRGPVRQPGGAVDGCDAVQLRRDDIEPVGDVLARLVAYARRDREANQAGAGAVGQFEARVEALAFERGLLLDFEADDFGDGLGCVTQVEAR